MTREEQKNNKELKKQLEDLSKLAFKKYGLKKKDYMFYISKNKMFYAMMFFMVDDMVVVYIYAKPFWLDDILWEILDMSDNQKAPISLRSVGAFTIMSKVKEVKNKIPALEFIDNLINSTFEDFVKFSNNYTEEEFLNNYTKILYQQG